MLDFNTLFVLPNEKWDLLAEDKKQKLGAIINERKYVLVFAHILNVCLKWKDVYMKNRTQKKTYHNHLPISCQKLSIATNSVP